MEKRNTRDRTAEARSGNRARGDARRSAILETAVEMIAQHGSRGVSLGDIAKAAGVSKTGLLHHFPTKDALLNAALDLRDAVDRHVNPSTDVVGLDVFSEVEEIFTQWLERPATLGLFTGLLAENLNVGDPLHERLVARAERVHTNLVSALRAGVERGDIRHDADVEAVAYTIVAFVNGLETYWQLDARIPLLDMVSSWRSAMVASIAAPRSAISP
ncbi:MULTISPECIES: TetR/AcrR family transcriptional regulator [unclassified Microbacterium]|uniref:TetR/AcrR family transcriptional regulator n=1 Tax=unclassified Microbacterium TaxID=2609290 RepID=UPI0006F5DB5D|nr:TetR/AcrR family transcriptional regulator [Microbacterium sp. Leaf436]